MIINVTSIRLRSLWKFFALSYNGMMIVKQTRSQPGFIRMKNTGFGYDHYTLSVWEDQKSLREFAKSGAHLDAMKKSALLATEIRTFSYESDRIPDWKEVKQLLQNNGKVFRY